MRCDQARDRIGALVDGELSAADSRAVMAHAEGCPACGRLRDELDALRSRLLPARGPAPRGLVQRVRAGLAVEDASPADEPAGSAPPARTAALAARMRQLPALVRQAAVVLIACLASIAATWWWV